MIQEWHSLPDAQNSLSLHYSSTEMIGQFTSESPRSLCGVPRAGEQALWVTYDLKARSSIA